MRSEGKPGYGFEGFAPPSARPVAGAAGYGSDPYNVRGAMGAGAPVPPAAAGPAVAPSQQRALPSGQAVPSASAAFARYFQDVRARIGMPVEELARRLNADPLTIYALEAGTAGALPPWTEVERVVTAYLTSLRLDPNPALKAIAAGIAEYQVTGRARAAAGAVASPALAAPRNAAPAMPGPVAVATVAPVALVQPAEAAAAPQEAKTASNGKDLVARLGGLFRRSRSVAEGEHDEHDEHDGHDEREEPGTVAGLNGLMRKAAMIAVMAFVGLGAVVAAQASLGKSRLNGPAAEFMRSATDSMALIFAPKREGLRWIEVDDPRSRRGDKLQTARR